MLGFIAAIAVIFLLMYWIISEPKPKKEEAEKLIKAIKEAGEVELIKPCHCEKCKAIWEAGKTMRGIREYAAKTTAVPPIKELEKEIKEAVRKLSEEASKMCWEMPKVEEAQAAVQAKINEAISTGPSSPSVSQSSVSEPRRQKKPRAKRKARKARPLRDS